jgi:hypothetical protein
MRFLIYTAHPNKRTDASRKYAGADVACWINSDDRLEARRKARHLIEMQGWIVDRLEEERPIARGDYAESSDGLQHFEQAQIDGEVAVFFTSPLET